MIYMYSAVQITKVVMSRELESIKFGKNSETLWHLSFILNPQVDTPLLGYYY